MGEISGATKGVRCLILMGRVVKSMGHFLSHFSPHTPAPPHSILQNPSTLATAERHQCKRAVHIVCRSRLLAIQILSLSLLHCSPTLQEDHRTRLCTYRCSVLRLDPRSFRFLRQS